LCQPFSIAAASGHIPASKLAQYQSYCLIKFFAFQLMARGTDGGSASSDFSLHELDQLYEFRQRIKPQQRQKPFVESLRFSEPPGRRHLEELD
jgi:hypothetical protein